MKNYPREGYTVKEQPDYTIPANTELEGIIWSNFFGTNLRCEFKDKLVDINIIDLTKIT
jgi:hypothetical protein